MGDIKYRIGLGTVGSGTSKGDVTAERPVDTNEVMSADATTRFTADSTIYFADGKKD